jgi:hypothetical protein
VDRSKSKLIGRLSTCLYLLASCYTMPLATAQRQGRQSIEVGALSQSTDNKVTGPYHIVTGPSSISLVGALHRQAFAGPFADYTWAFAPSLSLEVRAAYLPGKQPIAGMSGGSALLMATGLKGTVGSHRARFYARLAPGFVSFSKAGTGENSSGWTTSRLTHFAMDEGLGVEVRLTGANDLRFDVSRILYVEGGKSLSRGGVLPGTIEDHMTLTAGLAHYFGKPLSLSTVTLPKQPLNNEITISFALQRQPHLAFTGRYLSSDSGFAVSGLHYFMRWLGAEALAIVLPGGDTPNYQDGGTESEIFGGVRVGMQRPHYGVSASYRVGYVSFPDTTNDNTTATPPAVRSWDPANDAGAIFEFYPRGGHLLLRLDAGEQYTFYQAVTVKEPAPEYSAVQGSTYTWSPLILIGTGWRF